MSFNFKFYTQNFELNTHKIRCKLIRVGMFINSCINIYTHINKYVPMYTLQRNHMYILPFQFLLQFAIHHLQV